MSLPIPDGSEYIPIEVGSRVFIDFGDPELTALWGGPGTVVLPFKDTRGGVTAPVARQSG